MDLRNKKGIGKRKKLIRTSIVCKNPSPSCEVGTELQSDEKTSSSSNSFNDGISSPKVPSLGRRSSQRRLNTNKNNSLSVLENDPRKLEESVVLEKSLSDVVVKMELPKQSKLPMSPESEKTNLNEKYKVVETDPPSPPRKRTTRLSLRNNQAPLEKNVGNSLSTISSNTQSPCLKRSRARKKNDIQVENKVSESELKVDASPDTDLIPENRIFSRRSSVDSYKVVPNSEVSNLFPPTVSTSITKTDGEVQIYNPIKKEVHVSGVFTLKESTTFPCNKCSGALSNLSISKTLVNDYIGVRPSTAEKGIITQDNSVLTFDQFTQTVNCLSRSKVKSWDIVKPSNLVNSCSTQTHHFGNNKGVQSCVEIKDQETQIISDEFQIPKVIPNPKYMDSENPIHGSNKDKLSDLMLELIENLKKENTTVHQETITENTSISPPCLEVVPKDPSEEMEKIKMKKSSHHHQEKRVSSGGVSERKSKSSPEKVHQDPIQLSIKGSPSHSLIKYECSVVLNKLVLTPPYIKIGEQYKHDKTCAISDSKNIPIAQSSNVTSLPSVTNNKCNSSTFLLEQDVLAKKVIENDKHHSNSEKKGSQVSGKSIKEKTDDKLKSRNNKTSTHKERKRCSSGEKKDKKECTSNETPISLEKKSNLSIGCVGNAHEKLLVENKGKDYSVKHRKVEDKNNVGAIHSSKHKSRHEKHSSRRKVPKIEGNRSDSKCIEERVQKEKAESIDCIPDVTKVKLEVNDGYPVDDDDVIIYDDTYMFEIEEMMGGTEGHSKPSDCEELKKDLLQTDILELNEKKDLVIPTDNKSEGCCVSETIGQEECNGNVRGAVLKAPIKNVLKSPLSAPSEVKKKVTFKDMSNISVDFENIDNLQPGKCKNVTEKVINNVMDDDLEYKVVEPIELEKIKDEQSEDKIPKIKMENKSVGFVDVNKESTETSLEDGEIVEETLSAIEREIENLCNADMSKPSPKKYIAGETFYEAPSEDSFCLFDKPTSTPKTCVADVSLGAEENETMCPGVFLTESSRKYVVGDLFYEVLRENVVASTEFSKEDLAVDYVYNIPVENDTKSTGLVEPSKEPSKEPKVPYKIPKVSMTGSDVLIRKNEKRKPSETVEQLLKDKNNPEGIVGNMNSFVPDAETTTLPSGNLIEKEKFQSTSKSCTSLLGIQEKILHPEMERKQIENDRNLPLPFIFRGICFKFLRVGCSCLKFRHHYPPTLMQYMESTNSWDIYTILHYAIVKKFKKFLQDNAAKIVGILAYRKEANLFLDFVVEYSVNIKGTVEFWNAMLNHLKTFNNFNESKVTDILKFLINDVLHKYHVRQKMLNSMLEKIVVIACSYKDTSLFLDMMKFLMNDKIVFSTPTLELLLHRCLSVTTTSEKHEGVQIAGDILCSSDFKTPLLPPTLSLMMQLIDLLGENSLGLLAETLRNKIDCQVFPATDIGNPIPVKGGMCEQKPNSFEINENSYNVESVEPQGRNRLSLKRRSLHSDCCPPTKKNLVNNFEDFDSVTRFSSSNSPIGVPTCQSNFSESGVPVPFMPVCVNQTVDYVPSQGLVSAQSANTISPQVWTQENLGETTSKPCDSVDNGSSSDNITYSIPTLVSRQVDYSRTPFGGKKVTKNRNGGDSFLKVCHTVSMPNQINEDNISPSYQSESPVNHRNVVPTHSIQEKRQGFFPENNFKKVTQIKGQNKLAVAGYCDSGNNNLDYNKKNNSIESNFLIRIHPQENLKIVEPVLTSICPNEGSSLKCVNDQNLSKNVPGNYNSSPVYSLTDFKKKECAPRKVNDLEEMLHQCCWTVPAFSTFFGPWTSGLELERKLAEKLLDILVQDCNAAVYTIESLLDFMRTKEFLQMKISASIKRIVEAVIFNIILKLVILDLWSEAHKFLHMASSSNLSIMFSEAFMEDMSISRRILVLSEICYHTNDMDRAIEYLKKGNLFGSTPDDWRYDSLQGDLEIQVTLMSSLINKLACEGYSEMAPNTYLNVYRSQKNLSRPVDLLKIVNRVIVCALNGSCIDLAYEVYQTLTDNLHVLPKSTLRALLITLISEKRIPLARELEQSIRHIGIYPEFKESDDFDEILIFSYWQKEEIFIILDNALRIMCNNLLKNPQQPNFIKDGTSVGIRVKVCAIPKDLNVFWTSFKEDNVDKDNIQDPIPNRLALPINTLKDTHDKITYVLEEMIFPTLQFVSEIIIDDVEELFTLNPFSLMNHLYKRYYCGIDFNEKKKS